MVLMPRNKICLPRDLLHLSTWDVGLQTVLHFGSATSTGAIHCQAVAQPHAWFVSECRTSMTGRCNCPCSSASGFASCLQVVVRMDEARLHRELLHLFVSEGEDVTIPLSATGTGQVVTCPAIADGIDFGHQFTGRMSWSDAALCMVGRPYAAARFCYLVTQICCLSNCSHTAQLPKCCCHAVSTCLHCLQQVSKLPHSAAM